jgi:ribosomal-protein-alanine N-acetyltransferase
MINKPFQSLSLRLIKSRRLSLIAATPELIEKDLKGRDFLSDALDVSISETWPPDLYGPRAKQFSLTQLDDVAEHGWSFWYLLSHDAPSELVGICGFKGRPDESGSVEIGYSILSEFQRKGFASEAVARLVLWAFSHHNVSEVCAETLPHLVQSISVLQKNGFELTGAGSETGVIRYAIKRSNLN